MGSRWSAPSTKLDFVLKLPPELVAVILSYLTLSDVMKCLLVCKKWRDAILYHSPYWSNSLQKLGLSQRSISIGGGCFSNHKDFYIATSRHQNEARTLELVSSEAVCYPRYADADCFVMSKLNIMVRRERVGDTIHFNVEEILGGGIV